MTILTGRKAKSLITTNPHKAAYLLAAILGHELSVWIDADDLCDLINREWDIISTLAHAIHSEVEGTGPMRGVDASQA